MNGTGAARWLILAGVAVSAGCTVGPSAGGFRAATGPQGVWTELQFGRVGPILEVAGELISVADSGLYVLTPTPVHGQPGQRTLVYGSWEDIEVARFDQMGQRLNEGRPPSPADRATLSRVSRFPQGLSPELLADFLKAYDLEGVYVPSSGSDEDGRPR